MKVRPYIEDEMLNPVTPPRETLPFMQVWGDFLRPERFEEMESLTVGKLSSVVGIIRAMLTDEMQRTSKPLAYHIYRDGNRLCYSAEGNTFKNAHGDTVERQSFIEFASDADAEFFEAILHGVLRLALTRFEIFNGWNMLDGFGNGAIKVNSLGVVAA